MTLTQPVCGVDGVSVGLFLWIGSGTRAVLESRQKCEGNVLPYVFKTYGMFLWAPQSLLCPSLRKLMHQWGGGLHESSEEYSPPAWCSNTEPVHVCGRWCMQNVIENLLRPHPPPSYCCAPHALCPPFLFTLPFYCLSLLPSILTCQFPPFPTSSTLIPS